MLFQVSRRRSSTSVIIAISGVLVLIFLLFRINNLNIPFEYSSHLPHHYAHGPRYAQLNRTFGFQEIFVVNLPERTDRRDGMVLQAALSEIELGFIDGVRGDTVSDKALPPGGPGSQRLADANVGSWRGHMNAIREVVRRNLTSALILEDDADWDVRIKEQLYDFALTTRALIQPLSNDPSAYADSTYPRPKDASSLPASDFIFDQPPDTVEPKDSPYGDNWDLLWLGHCGMRFPSPESAGAENIPRGRVVRYLDATVPERQYLETVSSVNSLKTDYPSHTRISHHVSDAICSLGYAVTQAGAQHLLYQLGLMEMNTAFDLMLRQFCEGTEGKAYHNCLTVQPALFQHHRPAGNKTFESDITSHGNEYREQPMSENLRYSVRMNSGLLLDGRTDLVDQFPDTE